MNATIDGRAAFWNKVAPRYAAMRIRDPEGYEATLQAIAALLKPEDRLLEIGCGTGTTALRLSPLVAKVTATDFSEEMLAIARAKPGADRVDFRQADAAASIGDEPFDVICAFNLLHLVPDLGATLAQIRRQLKPDGIFLSKTPCVGEMSPMIRIVVPVLRVLGLVPPLKSLKREALVHALTEAGFAIHEIRTFGKSRGSPFILARSAGGVAAA